MELLDLKQTGMVEYRTQFELLIYNICLHDTSLSDTMLVSQILIGLKDDIWSTEELQLPTTFQWAAVLAQVQEQLLQRPKHSGFCVASGPQSTSQLKLDSKPSFSPSELWRAKQQRDYRRLNNLCFKCEDKYTTTHRCSEQPTSAAPPQVNAILCTSGDGGGILSDALLDVLESSPSFPSDDGAYLSLNAMCGTHQNRALQLQALITNKMMILLVGSGNSHTFINCNTLEKLSLPTIPIAPLTVRVANGNILQCTSKVHGTEWWLQGHTFIADANVIPIVAYDIILGTDWLEMHRPMTCDWLHKWISFERKGSHIKLQGILPSDVAQVSLMTGEELLKSHKGSDLWATMLLSLVSDDTVKQGLLQESFI